jgi:hypothetical protein
LARHAVIDAVEDIKGSTGSVASALSMRAPDDLDHRFRSKPITDSGASRSPIPEQADHRFRSKPITDSGQADQSAGRV